MWGVGPRENGFSLGGEAYWASGVHLYTPLPLVPKSGLFQRIRLHAFATSGSIVRNGEDCTYVQFNNLKKKFSE